MIQELDDKRVFINYGPIQMALDISINKKRQVRLGYVIAEYVIKQFQQLLDYVPLLKENRRFKTEDKKFPKVLNKMINAVNIVGDETINTLGAVAGSFSDIALEKALSLGATRVIINNGGDIALNDITGMPIKVGIPLNRDLNNIQLIIEITKEMDIHGICTSGLGGRSFTKGIATAAVALACNAAIADACATHLGNETNVEDKNIIRCLAQEIDSGTDIAGHMVTLKVGDLSQKKIYSALLNGLSSAEKLYKKEVIKGAILCIRSNIVMVPENIASLKK